MARGNPSHIELAVGSVEFLARAQADLARASRRVLIQAMTFEGDAAGQAVAAAITASPAQDRRVLVDDYTRHVINDRFLSFSRDLALSAEAEATWAMFDSLERSGIGLRLTNPVGANPLRYATRNHKKLLVIDDAAWIGGINFSDHNFAWHDMMVRIEHSEVADWLAREFERDWAGEVGSNAASVSDIDLLSLDGTANAAGFEPLLELIGNAQSEIEVVSAYPTFPFVDALAAVAARGVPVRLYTPRPNNKPVIRDYLLGVARRSGLDLRLTPMMTHAKALLVDGRTLVVGSSNFDFVSHRANAEYLATIRDPALIGEFTTRVLEALRQGAEVPQPQEHSSWRAWKAHAGLRIADMLVSLLDQGPRIAEWRRR
ncbi:MULTISPECIES: phospholipase D-like domain-containing protein [unclassified Novosphingobium]|uniref:phospholipase D-like domain-containing protein n=1 Tax=unclassified Novosphingobium TaxID=2644732 RepID=UPI0025F30DE5|nr:MULTISPECIES: phospholipase D-like domain-containing protein [unclassified Novosphingobium]HQV02046.1 phospholipase D-like domain-containing protein [Novosphingobium sp.]